MRGVLLGFLFGVLTISSRPAHAQGIPDDTLARLKAATVFIKVDLADGGATGSGFLIERSATRGLIATNHHVIDGEGDPVKKISCVFHSGTAKELAKTATVIGSDPERDLALLSISADDLPAPLDIATEVTVRETLPVFILGFPFGEALAASSRNPALTINKGSVSSIRRDDFDDVAYLQIDGGINPGNSGGPIVNETGALVGISVAKVRGAEIGMAIPKEQLADILQGSVGSVSVRRASGSRSVDLQVRLIDAHSKIKEVVVFAIRRDRAPKTVTRSDTGAWSLVSEDMKALTLELRGAVATGKAAWPNADMVFQVKLSRSDDTEFVTLPQVYRAATGEVAGASSPEGMTPKDSGGEVGEAVHTEKFDATISQAILAGAGRYIIVHTPEKAEAQIYDLTKRETVATMPAPEDAIIVASIDKVIVASTFTNSFERWSLSKLKKDRGGKLPVPGQIKAMALGHASKGPLLVNWAGQGRASQAHMTAIDISNFRGVLITPTERRVVKGLPRPRSRDEDTVIRASANGSTFGVWNRNRSPQGIELIRPGRNPLAVYEHNTAGYVIPNADGSAICTAIGLYSGDLVRKRGDYPCLPAATPDFYMAITKTGLELRRTNDSRVVVALPPLAEFAAEGGLRAGKLQLDQRFHLIPQLNLLVTLPPTEDRMVLRKVELGVEKKEKDADLAVASGGAKPVKPKGAPPSGFRKWRDKTGKHEIIAKLLSVGESSVKLEKEDGKQITVPFDKLSDFDVRYAKRKRE
jgi:S1-C subfamily serine protease